MKVIRSAKPYWIYLIITGKKKAEIGKDFPKSPDWDRTVEMYCSKDKKSFNLIPEKDREWMRKYLGKIACKFTCKTIDEYNTSWLDGEDMLKNTTCLDDVEIMDYMDCYTHRKFYCWNISDLEVYDNPKELSEFVGVCRKSCLNCKYVKYLDGLCDERGTYKFAGPPQSWCYAG